MLAGRAVGQLFALRVSAKPVFPGRRLESHQGQLPEQDRISFSFGVTCTIVAGFSFLWPVLDLSFFGGTRAVFVFCTKGDLNFGFRYGHMLFFRHGFMMLYGLGVSFLYTGRVEARFRFPA